MNPLNDIQIGPNQLLPRTAMGLPASLADRLGANALSQHCDLLGCAPQTLVEILESSVTPMTRRYAAGTVLAYQGDPRINLLEPKMIPLPGAWVNLGLAFEKVDAVVARWCHVGVVADWIRKECPRHRVELNPFALARFPVTNYEFRAFLEDTDSEYLPSSWVLGTYPIHLANHPVWTVTPEAADAYVKWISCRARRAFRLPTEAEWEYAACGGSEREFPWGRSFEANCANTVEAGPLYTTPVGMYPLGRTPTGIDDLAGNVEECTADIYKPYPGGEIIRDDLQLTQGDYRVARGGSFTRYGDLARCCRRHGWFHSHLYAVGFRLAESL